MINKSLFSSNSDEWSTPSNFFKELDQRLNFNLDVCANSNNSKCELYYNKEVNGLSKSWQGFRVWCNPPYSDIAQWCKKCSDEYKLGNCRIALLIPSRTDTKYFHDYVLPYAKIIFIKGRLHFNDSKKSAPFPSILCLYGFDYENK